MMDLYAVLGVSRSANMDEIKAAYRKRAVETHPDHGGDIVAFKNVSLAGEVLTDPDRRAHYDLTGTVNGSSAFEKSTVNSDERIEAEVERVIFDLVNEAFAKDTIPQDPIHWMRERIDRVREQCKQNISNSERHISRMSDRLDRFRQTNADRADSMVYSTVVSQIEEVIRKYRKELQSAKFNLKVTEQVMMETNGLSFKEKVEQAERREFVWKFEYR